MKALTHRLQQWPQGLQFVLVGGAAAATHLLLAWLLVQLGGLPPLAANVPAFLGAFVVSYNGHALFTFSRAQARGWAVALRYFAVACLAFAVNELLYAVALQWLGWHYLVSLVLVLLLVAFGTFALSKSWAFRPQA